MNKVRANALRLSRGFTLVELLIGLSISALVGGLVLSIMVNNTSLFYRQSAKVTQGVGANDTTSSIVLHIKQASSVDSTSSLNQLVLNLPSKNASDDSIADTFDEVLFYKDTDKIRLKVTPNSQSSRLSEDRILTNNAVDLEFKYFDDELEVAPSSASKVVVTVKLEQKTGTSTQTDISTTEAALRND